MKRRTLMKLGAGALVSTGAIGAGIMLTASDRRDELTLDAVSKKLAALKGKPLEHTGAWAPARVFAHCAQSIEFSLVGFPEHKPDWFKQSLGAAAFAVFSHAGKMTHGLDEPIPGAPSLENELDTEKAFSRLEKAISDFRNWQSKLEPHFAYGQLDQDAFAMAHVLHIENHLSEIKLKKT